MVPISAVMHGKLEHASHEDCAGAHASPIHGPGVNIMGVGTHVKILRSTLSMVSVKSGCLYSELRFSL